MHGWVGAGVLRVVAGDLNRRLFRNRLVLPPGARQLDELLTCLAQGVRPFFGALGLRDAARDDVAEGAGVGASACKGLERTCELLRRNSDESEARGDLDCECECKCERGMASLSLSVGGGVTGAAAVNP